MKKEYIDFTENELVPGTLTGMYFHFKIEKILEKKKYAILAVEADEKYPDENKHLVVFSKNEDNEYWQKRISTPYRGVDDEEMHEFLNAYNRGLEVKNA